jgi:hypothetical protein
MTHTKDIRRYDPDDVFALNPDMKITMSRVSEYELPLMIIDEFYQNPELVREVLINAPVPAKTAALHHSFPGQRVSLSGFINSQRFQRTYSALLQKQFHLDFEMENRRYEFIGNIFDGSSDGHMKHSGIPHTDNSHIASVVYLNYDDEKVGGTSIYQHRASKLPFFPNLDFHFKWWVEHLARLTHKPVGLVKMEEQKRFDRYADAILRPADGSFTLESNDEWEILATVEAKFNRLAGYIGATLHTAMIDYEFLKDKPYSRINQVLFMIPQHMGKPTHGY